MVGVGYVASWTSCRQRHGVHCPAMAAPHPPAPPPSRAAQVRARARRAWVRLIGWLRSPGRGPRWSMLAACAVILTMYCTNQDMAKQPDAPRGDGVYRPVLARGDGHMMYLMARSTALDGDWRLGNDLARVGGPWGQRTTQTRGKAVAGPVRPARGLAPLPSVA